MQKSKPIVIPENNVSAVPEYKKTVSFDLNPQLRNPEQNPYSYYTSCPLNPSSSHSLNPHYYHYNHYNHPPHNFNPPSFHSSHYSHSLNPHYYHYNPPPSPDNFNLNPPPSSHNLNTHSQYKKPPLYPKNNTKKYTSKSEELYRKYNGISPDEEALLLFKLLNKENRTIGTQTD